MKQNLIPIRWGPLRVWPHDSCQTGPSRLMIMVVLGSTGKVFCCQIRD